MASKSMLYFTLQRRPTETVQVEKMLRNGIYFIILYKSFEFLYCFPQVFLAAIIVKRKRRCNAGAFFYKLR